MASSIAMLRRISVYAQPMDFSMTSNEPPLSEKDFISESYKKDPKPFWVWSFIVLAITAAVLSINVWYSHELHELFKDNPFLQVTNRQMSLFLWQNPEFMRANVKVKNGYLPGFFYMDRIGMDPDAAEHYVIAPPELLFRYHTWQRLLGNVFIPQPIPKEDFVKFIEDALEWQPENWPKAPKEYVKMLQDLPHSDVKDLSTLPESTLPREVRMAYQGWHHFFIDREAINDLSPSNTTVDKFLVEYPHYARNYWRNIVEENYPEYLMDIDAQKTVPLDKMAPFLRVALFEFTAKPKP